MDKLTKTKRSQNMAAVKSKNTKPEYFIRRLLFTAGYRYRLYDKKLPGKPDLVLKKYRLVIFINGCFWHGHKGCPKATLPETHSEFWKTKIDSNIQRDRRVCQELLDLGYRVLIIWQFACLKKTSDKLFCKINRFILSDDRYLEIGRQDILDSGELTEIQHDYHQA